jgi:gluconate 2-dehydrogenase gamma chain
MPLFFSPTQFRLVEHLAEMIIPPDDTPGAKEAGVAEFIDFMVANRVPVNGSEEMSRNVAIGSEVQGHFQAGLGWLDAHSTAEFGHGFLDCSEQQQHRLLQEIAYKDKYTPTTEAGRDFFQLIRDYTVVGYYTTRIGLESLGYRRTTGAPRVTTAAIAAGAATWVRSSLPRGSRSRTRRPPGS